MKKNKLYFLAGALAVLVIAATTTPYVRNWFSTWAGTGLDTTATDNSVALSNYLASGGGIIPPGTYQFTNAVIVKVPTTLKGFGDLTKLVYTGPSNFYALTFTGGNSQLSDFTVDCRQWVNYGTYTGTVATAGGAISLFSIGCPRVSGVSVVNAHGNALYIAGDSDIFKRSNSCHVASFTVSNVYNGVWLAQSNYSEFTLLDGVVARRVQNCGVFIGSGNVTVSCAMLNGYVDNTSGDGIATGTGIFIRPSLGGSFPGRSHIRLIGCQVAHWSVGVNAMDATGPVDVIGGISGGVGVNVFSNCTTVKIVGWTSDTWSELKFVSVSQLTTIGCTFLNGSLTGLFDSYQSFGNTKDGAPLGGSTGTSDLKVWRGIAVQSPTLNLRPANTNLPQAFITNSYGGTIYYSPLYQ